MFSYFKISYYQLKKNFELSQELLRRSPVSFSYDNCYSFTRVMAFFWFSSGIFNGNLFYLWTITIFISWHFLFAFEDKQFFLLLRFFSFDGHWMALCTWASRFQKLELQEKKKLNEKKIVLYFSLQFLNWLTVNSVLGVVIFLVIWV